MVERIEIGSTVMAYEYSGYKTSRVSTTITR